MYPHPYQNLVAPLLSPGCEKKIKKKMLKITEQQAYQDPARVRNEVPPDKGIDSESPGENPMSFDQDMDGGENVAVVDSQERGINTVGRNNNLERTKDPGQPRMLYSEAAGANNEAARANNNNNRKKTKSESELPELNDELIEKYKPGKERDEFLTNYYEQHFLSKLNPLQQQGHIERMNKTSQDIKDFYYSETYNHNQMSIRFKNPNVQHTGQELNKIMFNHCLLKIKEIEDDINTNTDKIRNLEKKMDKIKNDKKNPENQSKPNQLTEEEKKTNSDYGQEIKLQNLRKAQLEYLQIIDVNVDNPQMISVATPFFQKIQQILNVKEFITSVMSEPMLIPDELVYGENNDSIRRQPVKLIPVEQHQDQLVLMNLHCNGAYSKSWDKLLKEHFPEKSPPVILKHHLHKPSNKNQVFQPFAQKIRVELLISLTDQATPTKAKKHTGSKIEIISHLTHCGLCKTTNHLRFRCPNHECGHCSSPSHYAAICPIRLAERAARNSTSSQSTPQPSPQQPSTTSNTSNDQPQSILNKTT